MSTFGSVDLRATDGHELQAALAQPKRVALLVYLAASRPYGVRRRDQLLPLFWPELDEDRARDALSQALRFLRQALETDVFVRRGNDEVGVASDQLWCDAVAFRTALDQARPDKALELYRGDFLEGFFVEDGAGFESWMERERAALRLEASRAAHCVAEQHEHAGSVTLALTWAERALDFAPDDERGLRRVLALRERAGDRAGALRRYDEFAKRLRAEYDCDPSPETTAIVRRIRAGGETSATHTAVAGVVRTLGSLVPGDTGGFRDHYRIQRELGKGGMATVYLARDLKHDRDVALKVLHPDITEGIARERFVREIHIAGRLQHPGIVPVFDSGEADGLLYYAMPHVQGETLREHLSRRGRVPVSHALDVLHELAGALAYAHGAGVIHRDIKPENILLTQGRVVVTDFGIARAAFAARTPERSSGATLTRFGTSLGTLGYMPPKQAAGESMVDQRADVYAVGVVAYEMLAGSRPFTGRSAREILAAQLTQTPLALSGNIAGVEPSLERVIVKCLSADPADRWQTAEVLLAELRSAAMTEKAAAPSGGGTAVAPLALKWPATVRRRRAAVAAGSVAALAAISSLALLVMSSSDGRSVGLGPSTAVTSEPGMEVDPALSPDGRTLAYAAYGPADTTMRIYVREVSGSNAVPVSGDAPGHSLAPRWSPDGSQILFRAQDSLFVVQALGGARRAVAEIGGGVGLSATWSPDGASIAYTARDSGRVSLYVRRLGGPPKRIVDPTSVAVHSPAWSPDGRWIAYVTRNPDFADGRQGFGNRGPSVVYLVPAAGGTSIALTDGKKLHASPVWLPDSRRLLLVSNRDGGTDIYLCRIDNRGRPTGSLERLTTDLYAGSISLSADGRRLAYVAVTLNEANIWATPIPAGAAFAVREPEAVTTGTQHIESMSISADGHWIAFDSHRGRNADIYKVRADGGEPIALTTDPGDDLAPEWSPDGRWVSFQSWRNGTRDIYRTPTDGSALDELVAGSPGEEFRAHWAPDSRRIVFSSNRGGSWQRLYVTERTDAGTWTTPQAITQRYGFGPRWSPDGRSIVYMGPQGIHSVARDGSSERVLLKHGFVHSGRASNIQGTVNLSPDGRTVYFRTRLGRTITFWALPAADGAPRPIVAVDDLSRSARAEFAVGRGRFYFTLPKREADIRVVTITAR